MDFLPADLTLQASQELKAEFADEVVFEELDRNQKAELARKVARDRAQFLHRLHDAVHSSSNKDGGLQSVEILYKGITLETDAVTAIENTPTVWGSVVNTARALPFWGSSPTTPVKVLDNVQGVLSPGKMTLVLGPPGSGKSILLKTLAGRIAPSKDLRMDGSVCYNGEPVDGKTFAPHRVAGFLHQQDHHAAELTVLETVKFASECLYDEEWVQRQVKMFRKLHAQATLQRNKIDKQLTTWNAMVREKPPGSDFVLNEAEGGGSVEMTMAGSGWSGLIILNEAQAAEKAKHAEELDKELEFLENLGNALMKRVTPFVSLELMGLSHAADTQVGNAVKRGVSGGERRRVGAAELLVGPRYALLLDGLSTGLDSATTHRVFSLIRDTAKALDNIVVASLLQPPPEVMDLFDDIILLTDGKVLYHGPVDAAIPFFESLGFACPSRKDPASFLQEVTTPLGQYLFATAALRSQHGLPPLPDHPEELTKDIPKRLIVSLEEMQSAFWNTNDHGKALQSKIDAAAASNQAPPPPPAAASQELPVNRYARPWPELFYLVLRREFRFMMRARQFYIIRFTQTTILGLIIGSLFYHKCDPPPPADADSANAYISNGRNAISLFSLAAVYIVMINVPQMGFIFAGKPVFFKQRAAGYFPSFSYVISLAVALTPASFVESVIFSVIVYWLVGLDPSAGRFFIFLASFFSISSAVSAIFRLVAYLSPDMVIANAISSFLVLVQMLANGFFLTRSATPVWLVWIYWANPLSWMIRSLAINELGSPAWDAQVENGPSGTLVLETFDLYTERLWIWAGFGFAWGFWLLLTLISIIAIQFSHPPKQRARLAADVEVDEELSKADARVPKTLVEKLRHDGVKALSAGESSPDPGDPAPNSSAAAASTKLPFTPVALVCRNIEYFVPNPSGGGKGGAGTQADKEVAGMLQILRGVNFFATPGSLTTLMGGSGAGKTTLMDVVAGRKTVGVIRGDILVNGRPKVQETWARMMGYVEQMDIHSKQVTVLESLRFSARLRLDGETVSQDQVEAVVQEALDTLDLRWLSDDIVGHLTMEQCKRLSIAVELVANPAVMFMDEPTSGLDGRAAAIVARAVRAVANSGRTVLVTIHQPSIEIFDLFDSLLLLQRGGKVLYFGPLGEDSCDLIRYLEGLPGVQKIPPRQNPATWMLEVTGGANSTRFEAAEVDFIKCYDDSEVKKAVDVRTEELLKEAGVDVAVADDNAPSSTTTTAAVAIKKAAAAAVGSSVYATSLATQSKELIAKWNRSYWRSPFYNTTRIVVALVVALLYGFLYLQQGLDVRPGQPPVTISTVNNLLGLLYHMCAFLGVANCMMVMPIIAAERVVYYRERAASMYSPWPYSLAQSVAELPYLIVQSVVLTLLVYWMVGFQAVAWKFFYFFLMLLFCITMYTYLGHFMVISTPSALVAQLIVSGLNQLFSYFNGYLLPYNVMPEGWKWLYRITPTSYVLMGLATSQFGDSDVQVIISSNGTSQSTVPLSQFIEDFYSFDTSMMWWNLLIVAVYCVFLRVAAAFMLRYVNYLKR